MIVRLRFKKSNISGLLFFAIYLSRFSCAKQTPLGLSLYCLQYFTIFNFSVYEKHPDVAFESCMAGREQRNLINLTFLMFI